MGNKREETRVLSRGAVRNPRRALLPAVQHSLAASRRHERVECCGADRLAMDNGR